MQTPKPSLNFFMLVSPPPPPSVPPRCSPRPFRPASDPPAAIPPAAAPIAHLCLRRRRSRRSPRQRQLLSPHPSRPARRNVRGSGRRSRGSVRIDSRVRLRPREALVLLGVLLLYRLAVLRVHHDADRRGGGRGIERRIGFCGSTPSARAVSRESGRLPARHAMRDRAASTNAHFTATTLAARGTGGRVLIPPPA